MSNNKTRVASASAGAAKKVIVRLDKIKRSVHTEAVLVPSDIRQGSILALGAYVERDYFTGVVPSAAAELANDSLVFISTPFVEYDEKIAEEDHVIKAGTIARGYVIERGDVVSITVDGIEGTPVVGQFVVPQSGKTMLKANATKSEAEINFKVIAKEILYGYDCFVLRAV